MCAASKETELDRDVKKDAAMTKAATLIIHELEVLKQSQYYIEKKIKIHKLQLHELQSGCKHVYKREFGIETCIYCSYEKIKMFGPDYKFIEKMDITSII